MSHEFDDLRVFNTTEVCERLQISRRTAYRLMASGELRTVRPPARGREATVSARALREYIYGGVA